MIVDNNIVTLVGTIESEFEYSHKTYREKFYKIFVSIKRLSGVEDFVPVIVSEKMIDINGNYKGQSMRIDGEFRSYRNESGLQNYVYANEIIISDLAKPDFNLVILDGYLCAPPRNRVTKHKKNKITDLFIAVNRPYGKSDYIPCICWNVNADLTKDFMVGDHVQGYGRIQSRKFLKGDFIKNIYEISISEIERVKDEGKN